MYIRMLLYYYLAWVQSLAALIGSLLASEVWHFAPCTLCWYQRYLMYPLAVIIAVGILKRSPRLPLYVLPFSLTGLGVAIYHNLLYWGVVGSPTGLCQAGVSCTARYFEWFGFITIPFLSALAFAIITLCMIFSYLQNRPNNG